MREDKYHFTLDRREFLKLVGGGIVVFFTTGDPLALQQRRGRGYPEDFNAYLRIGEDTVVYMSTPRLLCGLGSVWMERGLSLRRCLKT